MNKNYTKLLLTAVLAFFVAAEVPGYTAINSEAAQQEAAKKNLEKDLLGPYSNVNALTSSNIRHAYITFTENVRARHSTWTDQDWAQAKGVLEKLDSRKNAMDRILSVADKNHIRMLQAEIRALETKSDVKE